MVFADQFDGEEAVWTVPVQEAEAGDEPPGDVGLEFTLNSASSFLGDGEEAGESADDAAPEPDGAPLGPEEDAADGPDAGSDDGQLAYRADDAGDAEDDAEDDVWADDEGQYEDAYWEVDDWGWDVPGSYVEGTDGDDVLQGSDFDDDLYGGAGNDTLIGGEGSDWIDGGDGDDLLQGGECSLLDGGAGSDKLSAASDSAVLGGNGDDAISAGSWNFVAGGAGNDLIVLGGEYNVVGWARGDGDDVIIAGSGALSDLLLAGVADDQIEIECLDNGDYVLRIAPTGPGGNDGGTITITGSEFDGDAIYFMEDIGPGGFTDWCFCGG